MKHNRILTTIISLLLCFSLVFTSFSFSSKVKAYAIAGVDDAAILAIIFSAIGTATAITMGNANLSDADRISLGIDVVDGAAPRQIRNLLDIQGLGDSGIMAVESAYKNYQEGSVAKEDIVNNSNVIQFPAGGDDDDDGDVVMRRR